MELISGCFTRWVSVIAVLFYSCEKFQAKIFVSNNHTYYLIALISIVCMEKWTCFIKTMLNNLILMCLEISI